MAKTSQPQQQQIAPGAFFRVPGIGARQRFVPETGPCAPETTFTLNASSTTKLKLGKFTTLDIVGGYVMESIFSSKYTKGEDKVLTQSPLFPAIWLTQIQVQFESAYSTFRLPGFLAAIMQQYRPMNAPNSRTASLAQSGAAAYPNKSYGSAWFASATHEQLPTPTLALTFTGALQKYRLLWEIPVSMYFDLYYTLATNGVPKGRPIPRAIVSPQRMAASTRNVTPQVTTNVPLLTTTRIAGVVARATGDTTSAVATTKVTMSWWRTAWIPSDTMATEPPGRPWQYTRDYIEYQPSGSNNFPVPLDADIPGQGQILSMVFGTWTPSLTDTLGAFIPFADYTSVQLLLGSSIQLKNTAPTTNQYEWLMKHGSVLPAGFMGWDLALTTDGKLTNEAAINTLVQNGAQIRIAFQKTFHPSSSATVYVGMEVLKKVGQ